MLFMPLLQFEQIVIVQLPPPPDFSNGCGLANIDN
jgi:hypothetical protein